MDNIYTFAKDKLKSANLDTVRECSDETGIPYNTLLRIKYQDVNPRIETIQPVYNYFQAKEKTA